MALTVTATASGTGSNNGIALTVKAVTGAAGTQNGATASSDTFTTPELSITPSATGSWVYGALIQGNSSTTFTAASTTTFSQNVSDTTHGAAYGTFRTTGTTTASTPVTVGATAPTVPSGQGNIALAEILASGTLAEDSSSPAGVSSTSAKTVTTASFTPPGGSLLVATVSADYTGSGTVTMTVSDSGGLTWTKLVADPVGLTSVWIAAVPSTTTSGSAAMAPLGISGTAAETFTATGSAAMAPPGMTGSGAGGNTTMTGSLAMAPLDAAGTGSGGAATSPLAPLDLRTELDLAQWTDISSYVMQREGSSPPMTISRGRPDESASVNPATMTCQLSNRDGRFSPKNPAGPYYGLLGRNTPARVSVPAQVSYLRIEDDNTSAATCPDASALHITGDIDIRVDMDFSGYQTDYAGNYHGDLITKYTADSSTANSWFFEYSETGLRFGWYDGSSLHAAASTLPPPPRGRQCLRVTLQVSAGAVTFYTGPAGGATGSAWTQLGTTVTPTSGASTSIAVSAADLSVGNVTSGALTAISANGAYYEAAVYSGIAGTLVAHPVFSAQAAGATSFADSLGNTWTLYGTAQISSRSYRFHGEMSSLPVAWDSSGKDIYVPVAAAGPLRRLGQGSAPVFSPIKRALLAQSGTLQVVQYWPCEDLQGATAIGSAVSGPLMTVIGGTGDGSVTTTGPAFAADSSFLCSASLPTLNGSTWYGQVPAYTSNGSIVVRFLMKLGSNIPSGNRDLFRIITSGTCQEVSMRVYTSSELGLYGKDTGGNSIFDSGGVTYSNMPNAVWCSIELQPNGATVNYSLVTLVPGATTGYAANGSFSGSVGKVQAVYVNPAAVFTDTVTGHVSVQSAWESLFNLGSPLDAWQGEPAGQRFARLCSENGLQARVVGPPATTALMGAQSVATLTSLLQECEDADRGQIFEPRTCLGLGYRTQASLLNQPAMVTLDYSQAQLGQDSSTVLNPKYDDLYSRNDWTVQRSSSQVSGASYRYQLADGSAMSISPPPDGIGDYGDSKSLNVQSDSQLPDEAGWMVHLGTVDAYRWPAFPLNLARSALSSLYYSILAADIGDRFDVVNPPSTQLPPDEIRQLQWHAQERLGGYWYLMEWAGVPESPYETGVFDDLVYGRADTDGSTLAAAVNATATSLSVATTDTTKPLWTVLSSDFPFDIAIGGERITVTNITGSSSPQAFTVTRSVNGVSKTHAAGSDVRLWFPPVYAML